MDHHIDDEVLSAVLDDEATAEESAHARACPECGSRLARLRVAALAVAASPDPAPAATRRAAVAAAIQARAPVATEHEHGAGVRQPQLVLPGRRRDRPPRWALAAAAAVVVTVVAVPVLGAWLDGNQSQQAATDRADPSMPTLSQRGQESTAAEAAAPGDQPPLDGGWLGEVGTLSTDELAALIDRTGAGAPATASAGPCEAAARRRDAGLGPLRYTARATVGGEAVVVLGFETRSPPRPNGQPAPFTVRILKSPACATPAATGP